MTNTTELPPACGTCDRCIEYLNGEIHEIQTQSRVQHLHLPTSATNSAHLQQSAYHSSVLVQYFLYFLAAENKLDTQIEAQEAWKSWIPNLRDTIEVEELDLDFLFRLLDDLFFHGSLKYKTEIRWKTKHDPDRHGVTEDQGDWISIGISPPESGSAWTKGQMPKLLGTIVHEMMHAMFKIYSCRCTDCACHKNLVNTMGIKGHGPAFMELGRALEEKADEILVGLGGWDLGVKDDDPSALNERKLVREYNEETKTKN